VTTSSPPPADDPVATRVDALRAALAGDAAPAPTHPRPLADRRTPAPAEPAPDELAERLRRRRSAAHVAATYSAAHGHPLGAHDAVGRRWALDARTAVAAACALLLVAVVAVGLALWSQGSGDLVDLAAHDEAVPVQVDAGAAAVGPEPGAVASATPGASPSAPPTDVAPVPAGSPSPAVDAQGPQVVVHVVGKVVAPGLVTLPAGARVADALDAAGGATKGADLTRLNLARTVVDGEQVHVPAPGETPAPVDAGAGSAPSAGMPTPEPTPGAPVPLNTADLTTLDTLPGVGPVLAERIVAWRDANGPFTSVDELTEVSGIGPSVLEGLRDLVVV
jgi:competence protein ComEA